MGFFWGFVLGIVACGVLIWGAQHPDTVRSAFDSVVAFVKSKFNKGGTP